MERILGIDPGSHHLGWGVVEMRGTRFVHLGHGVCRGRSGDALGLRLLSIYEGLEGVLREFEPTEAGLEKVFSARNVRSALTLGQARGMVLLALAQQGILPGEYAPASVKAAVGAHGHGSKEQVALMVSRLLGVDLGDSAWDATDALAVALCHGHELRRQRVLRRAEGGI